MQNKQSGLNSGIHSNQVLTKHDEVCLSSILLAVIVICNFGENVVFLIKNKSQFANLNYFNSYITIYLGHIETNNKFYG